MTFYGGMSEEDFENIEYVEKIINAQNAAVKEFQFVKVLKLV